MRLPIFGRSANKMKRIAILLSLIGIVFPNLVGCVFVRPKASTVLTYAPTGGQEAEKVGFWDVCWRRTGNGIELIGYGGHPREHETYAFFINEPYPVYSPRWVHVTGEHGNYKINVILEGVFYSGILDRMNQKREKFEFSMENVAWDSPNHVHFSGKVVANHQSSIEAFDFVKSRYDRYTEAQNKHMERNG